MKKNTNSPLHLVDIRWTAALHFHPTVSHAVCLLFVASQQHNPGLAVAVSDEPETPHAMAIAMEWVSRIITVSLEMVLPGLGGQWLDRRWGTSPLLLLLGLALGLSLGVWQLIRMTRGGNQGRTKSSADSKDPES